MQEDIGINYRFLKFYQFFLKTHKVFLNAEQEKPKHIEIENFVYNILQKIIITNQKFYFLKKNPSSKLPAFRDACILHFKNKSPNNVNLTNLRIVLLIDIISNYKIPKIDEFKLTCLKLIDELRNLIYNNKCTLDELIRLISKCKNKCAGNVKIKTWLENLEGSIKQKYYWAIYAHKLLNTFDDSNILPKVMTFENCDLRIQFAIINNYSKLNLDLNFALQWFERIIPKILRLKNNSSKLYKFLFLERKSQDQIICKYIDHKTRNRQQQNLPLKFSSKRFIFLIALLQKDHFIWKMSKNINNFLLINKPSPFQKNQFYQYKETCFYPEIRNLENFDQLEPLIYWLTSLIHLPDKCLNIDQDRFAHILAGIKLINVELYPEKFFKLIWEAADKLSSSLTCPIDSIWLRLPSLENYNNLLLLLKTIQQSLDENTDKIFGVSPADHITKLSQNIYNFVNKLCYYTPKKSSYIENKIPDITFSPPRKSLKKDPKSFSQQFSAFFSPRKKSLPKNEPNVVETIVIMPTKEPPLSLHCFENINNLNLKTFLYDALFEKGQYITAKLKNNYIKFRYKFAIAKLDQFFTQISSFMLQQKETRRNIKLCNMSAISVQKKLKKQLGKTPKQSFVSKLFKKSNNKSPKPTNTVKTKLDKQIEMFRKKEIDQASGFATEIAKQIKKLKSLNLTTYILKYAEQCNSENLLLLPEELLTLINKIIEHFGNIAKLEKLDLIAALPPYESCQYLFDLISKFNEKYPSGNYQEILTNFDNAMFSLFTRCRKAWGIVLEDFQANKITSTIKDSYEPVLIFLDQFYDIGKTYIAYSENHRSEFLKHENSYNKTPLDECLVRMSFLE